MDRQKRFRRQKCSTLVLGAQAKEDRSYPSTTITLKRPLTFLSL